MAMSSKVSHSQAAKLTLNLGRVNLVAIWLGNLYGRQTNTGSQQYGGLPNMTLFILIDYYFYSRFQGFCL